MLALSSASATNATSSESRSTPSQHESTALSAHTAPTFLVLLTCIHSLSKRAAVWVGLYIRHVTSRCHRHTRAHTSKRTHTYLYTNINTGYTTCAPACARTHANTHRSHSMKVYCPDLEQLPAAYNANSSAQRTRVHELNSSAVKID